MLFNHVVLSVSSFTALGSVLMLGRDFNYYFPWISSNSAHSAANTEQHSIEFRANRSEILRINRKLYFGLTIGGSITAIISLLCSKLILRIKQWTLTRNLDYHFGIDRYFLVYFLYFQPNTSFVSYHFYKILFLSFIVLHLEEYQRSLPDHVTLGSYSNGIDDNDRLHTTKPTTKHDLSSSMVAKSVPSSSHTMNKEFNQWWIEVRRSLHHAIEKMGLDNCTQLYSKECWYLEQCILETHISHLNNQARNPRLSIKS